MKTFYNFDPNYDTNPTEFYWFQEAFTSDEIDKIITDCNKIDTQHATIAGGGNENEIAGIRK